MSWEQRNEDYNRRGNDRNVNRNNEGGLSITKSFQNNGGGYRQNDNRNGGGYQNSRGRAGNDNYRGGNGQYNNNNNYNNNNKYQGGRGGGGGGGNRADAPKKLPGNMMPRKEEEVPSSVQLAHQIMTRLGDFSAMTEQDDLYANIQALAHTFVNVGDLKVFPAEISDLMVKCFSQLSVQTPIMATMLALIHTHEPEFTALVAEKLQSRYLQAVAQDEVVVAKLLLRAVTCLAGALTFEVEGSGGLVEILTPLLTGLTQELAQNTDSTKALRLSESAQAAAYLLSSTLVWAAPVLQSQNQQPFLQAARVALEQIKVQYVSAYALGGLQAVFSAFSPVEEDEEEEGGAVGANRVLSVGPGVYTAAGESLLSDGSAWDSLWEAAVQALAVIDAVQQAAAAGTVYEVPAYFNAHWTALIAAGLLPAEAGSPGSSVKLSFGATFAADWAVHSAGLGAKAAHCHPSGSCTTAIGSTASSTWLRLRMNIFDASISPDCAHTAELNPLQKYAALTYLEDVFTFFDPVINEDGTKLGSMELLTTHLQAVFKLFPAGAHLEYMLIELLLQIVLQQPVNTALGTSVFRLILELCRAAPQVFPPVVALGTNTIFQLLPDLDSGSVLEFGRWFSFHLINTQLAWPAHYWAFWVTEQQEALENGQEHGIPLFLRFVVEKVSYAAIPDKVRAALPQELHSLIPAATPANCILFQAEGSTGVSILSHIPGIAAEARHLRKLIEEKTDPEEVGDWLEEVSPGASEGMEHYSASGEPFCWRGCLLLQVLLHVGAQSSALSAMVGLLDRYSEPLLTHVTSEEHHLDLLAMLAEVYGGPNNASGNGYMYYYLLDEMMRRGQIGVSAAAKVLVDAQSGDWRGNPTVYQCVESLLDRSTDFVRAAVAQRSLLGGELVLDESLDLTPSAQPQGETEGDNMEVTAGRSSLLPVNNGEEQVDYDEEMDEEREEGNRKRTRRDPDQEANGEKEEAQSTLWAAEEALKEALRNSRSVYSTVTSSLQAAIVAASSNSAEAEGEGEMDEGAGDSGVGAAVTACSLLRRTLRVFHGTERHLSHQHQQQVASKAVVVSAAMDHVQAFLQELKAQAGMDTSRWAAQIAKR